MPANSRWDLIQHLKGLMDRIFVVGIATCRNDTNTCSVFYTLRVLVGSVIAENVMLITILNVDNGSK